MVRKAAPSKPRVAAAQPVAAKPKTFADRFTALKGDTTFQEISDRLKKMGHQVSPQAVHKWGQGGGITPENLEGLSKALGVEASELYFGQSQRTKPGTISADAELISYAWDFIPERFQVPLWRDILKLASVYAKKPVTENDEAMKRRLDQAVKELPEQ